MRSRAGRPCDWIESYCPIPEGAHVGEWMALMPFQREFIDAIYNDQKQRGPGAYLPEIEPPFGERDTAALELALEQCQALGEERNQQIAKLLTERPRRLLACYIMQAKNLDLQPHETAPCWGD